MTTLAGLMAMLAGIYLVLSYVKSGSRELDELIALEEKAEQLRKRNVYSAEVKTKSVQERNRVLVKLARRRREVVSGRKIRSHELNRMIAARRLVR